VVTTAPRVSDSTRERKKDRVRNRRRAEGLAKMGTIGGALGDGTAVAVIISHKRIGRKKLMTG